MRPSSSEPFQRAATHRIFDVRSVSHAAEKIYLQFSEGAITACLAVEVAGTMAYVEGLLWLDGRVLDEFTGAISICGQPLEEAVRHAIAQRWR